MKQIQVHSFLSTHINPDFDKIVNIEIEDKPFAEGGFGEVYHCISINGNKIRTPQVIKIFKEIFPGSATDNANTIHRLQKKLDNYEQELKKNSKNILKEFPAFRAIPQFSFEGYLNGVLVKGFSSDNLSSQGYHEFEKILSDKSLIDKFYKIPVPRRIYFAFQLVSAFRVLDEFKYIHADLKPAAIFLNLNTEELAIIDYDSGVITENIGDEPSTWGAPNDWVAPEIWEQQINLRRGEKIIVDSFTDRWSVAVGVNYLITGIHPLFYLTELSPRITKQYFGSCQWPNVDKTASYYSKDNDQYYDQYIEFLNLNIPSQIKEKIANTINFGYKNSVARTPYRDWELILKSIQLPPILKYLNVSSNTILEGETATIAWKVENANSVEIDNNIGSFGSIDKKAVAPSRSTTYHIRIKGYYGELNEQIAINVIPAPKFIKLQAKEVKIKKGAVTNIEWVVENATELKLHGISDSPTKIALTGTIDVKPNQTTTYKIDALALDGKTYKEQYVTIGVFEEGKINSFKSDKQFIFPTTPIVLSWDVNNATKVELEGIGVFQGTDQVTLYPQKDTIYTLLVTDNFSTIRDSLQVKILPLPVIEKVLIPTPILQNETSIQITMPAFNSCNNSSLRVVNEKVVRFSLNSKCLAPEPKFEKLAYVKYREPFTKRLKNVFTIIKKEIQNEFKRKNVLKRKEERY